MVSGLGLLANAVEIAFAGMVSAAVFVFFRHKGSTLAEAGAYGAMAMIMLHSWLAQVLLLIGWQGLFTAAQLILLAAAAGMIGRHRRLLAGQIALVRQFACAHWPAVGSMLLAWAYLAAVWLGKAGHAHIQSASLGAGFWMNRGLVRAAQSYSPLLAVPVLNHAVLLAPGQPTLAPGIANLAAYMAIALATYALARRYAWPPTAITVSLLVVSMPRLAHQSLSAYSELLPAAAALLAVLALYRALEQPHGRDAAMLVCAIAFTVSGGRLCFIMPSVLAALSLLVLGRRHDIRLWPQAMRRHLAAMVITAALVLVFSQIPTIAVNLETERTWIGELAADNVAFHYDGLTGTAANMARYILQSIQAPEIVDRFGQQVFGVSAVAGLKLFYQSVVHPLVDGKGAAAVFDLSWDSRNGGGWFGPVGFLLVMPSLINAFWRGPHRLKTTALALAAYWILIALIAAWQPSNVHLMTPLFVASGFTMAFFLPPWRLGRRGRLALQLFGIVMLAGDMLP